jgi:hypothetical protein
MSLISPTRWQGGVAVGLEDSTHTAGLRHFIAVQVKE